MVASNMTPRVPHFRVPFRIVGGKASVVEQDSQDELAGCVTAILAYEEGSRFELPEFGISDLTFTSPGEDRLGQLRHAVTRWEPRAAVAFSEDLSKLDEFIVEIQAQMTTPSREG